MKRFRGKTVEDAGLRKAGEWAYGGYFKDDCYGGCPEGKHYIVEWNSTGMGYFSHTRVELGTVCHSIGKRDKNKKLIYEGDIVDLMVSGVLRRFVVKIKTVVREVVSHPSFEDSTAKVEITGVVFEWNGFELFPCIKENGKSDIEDMVVIGDIYNNPELLEELE